MTRIAVGIAVFVTLIGSPAFAADMAVKASSQPAAAPAPAYSWTGFYIGANGGYGWKDPTVTFTPNDNMASFLSGAGGASTSPSPAFFGVGGSLGGVQAGYNRQTNQRWLVGIEADFDWSGIHGSGSTDFNFPLILASSPSNFAANQNVEWFGTISGRLGWTPTDSMLLYGTAGFAYGRVTENAVLNTPRAGVTDNNGVFGFLCATSSNCFVGNSSRTATGWTAGGGVEYALSQHLNVKAEYLYVNLGHGDTFNVVAQATSPGTTPSSFTAAYSRADFNVVRGGLNWRFD